MWILSGGLMLSAIFMAVVTIQQLVLNDGQMATQNQPVTISPDQLSPEILEQLEQQMQDQGQSPNQMVNPVTGGTDEGGETDAGIIGDTSPVDEEDGAQPE